jgi:hypothetical protein
VAKSTGLPVITVKEFIEKYGTRGFSSIVEAFVARCPNFPGGEELVRELGTACADLESALKDTTHG